MFTAQVVPVCDDTEVPLLLGLFLSLRHMVPHLGASEPGDTHGLSVREEDVTVSIQQLIQVRTAQIAFSNANVPGCLLGS